KDYLTTILIAREKNKRKRQIGQTYISSNGIDIKEKTFSAVSSCCKNNAISKYLSVSKKSFLERSVVIKMTLN
ncbi:hypothetical protein ANN_22777, partial [Periplaneta americana]